MKVFKALGNVIGAISKTVEDSAGLVSDFVGEDGLKHTNRQFFKFVNINMDDIVIEAEILSEANQKALMLEHGLTKKPGRPKKSNA